MTDSPLEPIDLLDTDWADILARSSNPPFELQLVKSGINPREARIKTNYITLVCQKPETPEQWAALTEAWEAACGDTSYTEDFQQIVELMWKLKESEEQATQLNHTIL